MNYLAVTDNGDEDDDISNVVGDDNGSDGDNDISTSQIEFSILLIFIPVRILMVKDLFLGLFGRMVENAILELSSDTFMEKSAQLIK